MASSAGLSEEEAKIYDRQIRLWGVESQKRMQTARLLVIGATGVCVEALKNLVLAGFGTVHILDHRAVTEEDLGSQFFFSYDDIGKNRAEACLSRVQALNPHVVVEADSRSITNSLTDAEIDSIVSGFDVILATTGGSEAGSPCPLPVLSRFNAICRSKSILFLAAGVYGMLGFIFVDFGNNLHFVQKNKSKDNEDVTTEMTLSFIPLETALASIPKRSETTSALYLTYLLLKFEELHGRLPLLLSEEDAAELNKLRQSLLLASPPSGKTAIPSEALTSTAAQRAAISFTPVCAVLGGVIAQELLKGVTRTAQQPPAQNFFLWDGEGSMCGYVEYVQ